MSDKEIVEKILKPIRFRLLVLSNIFIVGFFATFMGVQIIVEENIWWNLVYGLFFIFGSYSISRSVISYVNTVFDSAMLELEIIMLKESIIKRSLGIDLSSEKEGIDKT